MFSAERKPKTSIDPATIIHAQHLPMTLPTNSSSRIFFLDHLRAFTIVLVVVLHGAITYMVGAPAYWYVIDQQTSLAFTILVLLIDVPIMLVIFFISGFFALPSLAKKGAAGFIKDKFVRIGAPWLAGVLFLAPPTAYLIYYTRNVPMSLYQFWTSEFWTKAYQQSVYWYLGVLFFFFLILSQLYSSNARLRSARYQATPPSWKFLGAFWLIMSAGMLAMSQFFPLDTWYTQIYILVFQPERLPLYIGYFVLGIYAWQHRWFSPQGYHPRLRWWGVLWLVSALLYIANRVVIIPANMLPTLVTQIAHAGLFNTLCLASLMAGTAFFQQRAAQSGPVWGSLSANAYGIYYIHPLIEYPLAYLFTFVSLPLALKAALVILAALGLSWAFSAAVLTKMPLVRRAFG